jgi:drug/metabolite transporter (DMT)-like permease
MQLGAGVALAAAVLFGLSTPFVRRFGAHAGPFSTAALLYAGAALASVRLESPARAFRERRTALRLALVAVSGAVLAPACLAWGLTRTSALTGSLLLGAEAIFTVGLAALVYREPLGRRVLFAMALLSLASALLVRGAANTTTTATTRGGGALGAVAVLAASFFWALDNTLTRPLADMDSRRVVFAKASLGALFSLALATSEPRVAGRAALGLLVVGALGYGVSVRLYLVAQRRVGAARTASVFAAAPFLGAVASWGLGDGHVDALTLLAAALVASGVTLHLRESHGHEHLHPEIEHEHVHRHDDGHHDHVHEPPVEGEHSHPHRH